MHNFVIRPRDGLAKLIFDNAPIGIYTVRKDGTIDLFNPKFLEINGAGNEEDVLGLNIFNLPSYKKSGLDTYIRDALAGRSFTTVVEFTSSAGNKKTWRRYRGVPIFEEKTNIITHILLLVEDITEQKNTEIKLTAYARELEKKIEESEENLKKIKGLL